MKCDDNLSKEKSLINVQLLHFSPFEEEMSILMNFRFLHLFRPCLHGHFRFTSLLLKSSWVLFNSWQFPL